MTELKLKFLDLLKFSLLEFDLNHPGTSIGTAVLERAYNIPEDAIENALKEGSLAEAIKNYIHYEFTGGRNGFKKPAWLQYK